MAAREHRLWNPWRIAGWGGLAFLLLLPAIAMQFTSEVDWDETDFIIIGIMLGLAGLGVEGAVRSSDHVAYRAGAVVAVGSIFLLTWVNLAVGFLGDEDNPANLMFAAVVGVAIIGSIFARFRPAGMAVAMTATMGTQILAGAVGLIAGLGSPGWQGIYEAVMGTGLFSALWFLAASLFRTAAKAQSTA